jgi:hypothetical protein
MSLIDLVATRINPPLVEVLQDNGNAIVLTSFLYDEVDARTENGWFFLPRADISQFTGFDANDQIKAEKILKGFKLIKVRKFRFGGQLLSTGSLDRL